MKKLVWVVLAVVFHFSSSQAVMQPGSPTNPDGPISALSPKQYDPNAFEEITQQRLQWLLFPAYMRVPFIVETEKGHIAEQTINLAFYQLLAQTPVKWKARFLEIYFSQTYDGQNGVHMTNSMTSDNRFSVPTFQGQKRPTLNLTTPVLGASGELNIYEAHSFYVMPISQAFFRLRALYKSLIYAQIMEREGADNFRNTFAAVDLLAELSFVHFAFSLIKDLEMMGSHELAEEIFTTDENSKTRMDLANYFNELLFKYTQGQMPPGDFYASRIQESVLGAYNNLDKLSDKIREKMQQQRGYLKTAQGFESLILHCDVNLRGKSTPQYH